MFEIVKNNKKNTFYPVNPELVQEAETNMGIILPDSLKTFYSNVGYGFLKTQKFNINRIMGPGSIEEFYLGTGQFENYEEADFVRRYTKDKVIFFEANESLYLAMGISVTNMGKIYYYDEKIAENLDEFFLKYMEDEGFFLMNNY